MISVAGHASDAGTRHPNTMKAAPMFAKGRRPRNPLFRRAFAQFEFWPWTTTRSFARGSRA